MMIIFSVLWIWLCIWAYVVASNPEVILDGHGQPYLIRYFLWKPKNKIKYGRLYLHHIVGSDEDRVLHDHPWAFSSLILKGGYYEHADIRQIPDNDLGWASTTLGQERKWFGAPSILHRGAGWRHRLELKNGKSAWTLVYTSPKVREWGFYLNGDNFCHHLSYDYLTGLCNED